MKLYIDTTQKITVGLLNKENSWIVLKKIDSNLSSELLHLEINSILESYQLNLLGDIELIYYCAGPGSYTGMRVSEGFAQTCLWAQLKVRNFYLFHIPEYLGFKSYRWSSFAFKGEYFLYVFDQGTIRQELISKEEYEKLMQQDSLNVMNFDTTQTKTLIENNPQIIFDSLERQIENDLKNLFYFRTLETEFLKPNKDIT
jgi:tRNA threonylcarbamoyladenosine biosynthesis protein TsaB